MNAITGSGVSLLMRVKASISEISCCLICFLAIVVVRSPIAFAGNEKDTFEKVRETLVPVNITFNDDMYYGLRDMNFTPGFREMSFGDSVEKLGEDAEFVRESDDGRYKYYSKITDKLFIENIPLVAIEYEFGKGLLCSVQIYSDLKYLEKLADLCISKYGEPKDRNRDANGLLHYSWLMGDSTVVLCARDGKATLFLADRAMAHIANDERFQEGALPMLPSFLDMHIGWMQYYKISGEDEATYKHKLVSGDFTRASDKRLIENSNLKKIEYHFTNGMLTGIAVLGNKDSFDELANICVLKYGIPHGTYRVGNLEPPLFWYIWKDKLSEIVLMQGPDGVLLAIGSDFMEGMAKLIKEPLPEIK